MSTSGPDRDEDSKPMDPMDPNARIVIVGGNLAGGTAAAALRSEGFAGHVTLIGDEPDAPYERPALSKQYLTSTKTFDEVLTRPVAFYAENSIETRFGVSARAIDTDAHEVVLADGETVPYDRLLLATGSRNRRISIPGLDLPGVHDLRTRADADALRAEVRAGGHAVVLGMGFVGSEVAASLRESGMEVTVVELLAAPLLHSLGAEISTTIRDVHAEHGVTMLFGERVTELRGQDRVDEVVLAGGQVLPADLVVFGFGSEPAVELAVGTDIVTDDGIVVDEHCRTSVADVYAAGDVASHHHPALGRQIRVEHWQNAVLQSRVAARSMLGHADAVYDDVHWFWSDQYDLTIHYAGFHEAWDETVVRGDVDDRRFAVFYLSGGRLVGTAAIGIPREVRFSMDLIRAGLSPRREDLADPTVGLRSLLPAAPV